MYVLAGSLVAQVSKTLLHSRTQLNDRPFCLSVKNMWVFGVLTLTLIPSARIPRVAVPPCPTELRPGTDRLRTRRRPAPRCSRPAILHMITVCHPFQAQKQNE